MLKLLMLIGLGVAGYVVTKKVINQGSAADEPDDLYGSADLHHASD